MNSVHDKNSKLLRHIQEFAFMLWRGKGMDDIFNIYHLDWTPALNREIPIETYMKLWECLIETEANRFAAVAGSLPVAAETTEEAPVATS